MLGAGPHRDFNRFMEAVAEDATGRGVQADGQAEDLVADGAGVPGRGGRARHQEDPQERHGGRPAARAGLRLQSTAGPSVVEYEPDTDLRDTEQIPLQEEGGIEAFLRREVLPYAG